MGELLRGRMVLRFMERTVGVHADGIIPNTPAPRATTVTVVLLVTWRSCHGVEVNTTLFRGLAASSAVQHAHSQETLAHQPLFLKQGKAVAAAPASGEG